ncbi:MAG: hypothetical protein A3G13_01080 [Candidatus Levybacteria bacterium RIFCSPLOWO2_12_FULL_37_7]|nr:MAG: hypothetical protein A3G13_01080 [Candidatus Levybacteria bacterium RIFCSPLOWO2_12_FULL_37_7]
MSSHSHYHRLKNKWIDRHRNVKNIIWEKHQDALNWAINSFPAKQLVAGSLGGMLLLSATSITMLPKSPLLLTKEQHAQDLDTDTKLMLDLKGKIPSDVRPLSLDEEESIAEILTKDFGFRVTSSVHGKKLNRSYGLIGYEQHLVLFPGDTIYSHFENDGEFQKFSSAGMAPGLSAWRYFAFSKHALTQKDILREKYYIAVQTFLAPGFDEHVAEFRNFFKYRKMLVINPENGKAIVCDIADAGPSPWTGKHLGGSPEVMSYLHRVDGAGVGPVLYFFIDDPEDVVSLGPATIR